MRGCTGGDAFRCRNRTTIPIRTADPVRPATSWWCRTGIATDLFSLAEETWPTHADILIVPAEPGMTSAWAVRLRRYFLISPASINAAGLVSISGVDSMVGFPGLSLYPSAVRPVHLHHHGTQCELLGSASLIRLGQTSATFSVASLRTQVQSPALKPCKAHFCSTPSHPPYTPTADDAFDRRTAQCLLFRQQSSRTWRRIRMTQEFQKYIGYTVYRSRPPSSARLYDFGRSATAGTESLSTTTSYFSRQYVLLDNAPVAWVMDRLMAWAGMSLSSRHMTK